VKYGQRVHTSFEDLEDIVILGNGIATLSRTSFPSRRSLSNGALPHDILSVVLLLQNALLGDGDTLVHGE
jgi:hypothetical protein